MKAPSYRQLVVAEVGVQLLVRLAKIKESHELIVRRVLPHLFLQVVRHLRHSVSPYLASPVAIVTVHVVVVERGVLCHLLQQGSVSAPHRHRVTDLLDQRPTEGCMICAFHCHRS